MHVFAMETAAIMVVTVQFGNWLYVLTLHCSRQTEIVSPFQTHLVAAWSILSRPHLTPCTPNLAGRHGYTLGRKVLYRRDALGVWH